MSGFMRTTHSELVSEEQHMLAAHTTQFWRSRPLQGRRPAAFFAALVVYIIVILVAAPQAQQPQAFNPTATGAHVAIRDAASGSEIELMVGDRRHSLDARPSDAISLALRTGCPIFVARDVIVASSTKDEAPDEEETPSAESTLDLSEVDREEWNEILENLDPGDFKYKM